MKIKAINAIKQLSSMGNETIKVSLVLEKGYESLVSVPAGISAGKYEAKNVSADEALSQIESIKQEILQGGWEQDSLDRKLVELNLGANTSLAISAAFWKALNIVIARPTYQKFPKLLMLLFEGGKHGNPALTIQEFLLVEDSLQVAIDNFKKMKQYLISQKIETTVGAEGGFSPMNFTNQLVLEIINEIFPNHKLGLDAAGSFGSGEDNYEKFMTNNNIIYLEDPYSDDQWDKWSTLLQKYGNEKLIVGDDLTVTNPERIKKAINQKSINSVIIKPNQNGTISGTLEAVSQARKSDLKIIVSHRGEETDDTWIVYFALSVNADYVKFGGMNRGERIAKYNRLLELGMK